MNDIKTLEERVEKLEKQVAALTRLSLQQNLILKELATRVTGYNEAELLVNQRGI
jgi:hypothetical protein